VPNLSSQMIDQDGEGGGHSLAKLLEADKAEKEEKTRNREKNLGRFLGIFWRSKKYFFLFFSFHLSFLCQAIEVAETHFILSNPHHPSAAFSQKVNTPAVSARKDRVWFKQAKRSIQHAIELSRACNYYEI
jgi:hypothetical protein